VIDLLGTNESGLARVCANTNGTESDAAELAALGFTDDELLTLAQTYSPATNSLWRVPIQHFSTYDCNYGIVPEDGAEEPQVPTATGGEIIPSPQVNCGNSGIEVENQILTEWLPLPGTPYRLVYSSQTASSNPKFKKMRIPVSGDTLPANVSAIRLKMLVAGKPYQYDLPAETNQTVDFSWDGTDVYGRSVKGAQPVSYSVEYLYPGYYSMPPRMSASFGAASGEAIPGMISSRTPAVLRKKITSTVGSFDAASRGLGGWMLNVHHVYDPVNQRVYLGTGRTRDGVQLMTRSSETEWVTDVLRGTDGNSLDAPHGLDLGADGSVYVADSSNLRVARINRRGDVTTLTDMPTYLRNLTVGPKGYVYVTTTSYFGDLAVYRIALSGQKEIFAGTGGQGPRISGVKATELHIDCQGISFAPDGTAFIADKSSNVIWRVGTDGIANLAAGRLEAYGGYDGDGLPALESRLLYPYGVAYDDKTGRLYICDSGNNRLRAITIGGYLLDIAGDGSTSASGDGGQAIDAGLWEVRSVAVGVDGSIFVVQRSTDPGGGRLRQILPDGRIVTLAGEGEAMPGEGRSAKNCQFDKDWPIAVGPDGFLYVTGDDCIYRFCPATRPIEAEADDTLVVASLDASQLYVFDLNGRHLRTLDALTGATNLSFSYTDDGFVESITDLNGRTTQIHRDGGGFVSSIEAPGGQSVAFTLDGDYYIDSATYPDTGQYQMDYTNTLLSSFTRPRGFSSTYEYDDDGNLVKYVRPDGGTGVLSRASESSGWTVTHTNPIGVVQTYETELTDVGGQWTRVHYSCYCGPNFDKYTSPDGLSSNTDAEGVLTLTQTGSDPRFGVQAPYTAWSVLETPLGLQFAMTNQLTAGIPDSDAPQNFAALTNITVVNERTYVSIFDREARVQTDTSPLGRVNITGLDGRGRIVYEQQGDQAGVTYGYDGRGYLSSITIGSGGMARVTSVAVDNHGNITNYTDSESRVTETDYDACNRLTNWTRASAVNVAYDRDLEGNRTLIRTPVGEAHTFTYTSENLLESYSTPVIGGVSNLTQWFYNGAGLVDFIGYPDGSSEEYIYDEAGRVQWRGYNDEGDYYSYGNIMGGSLLTRIESSNGVVVEYFYDGTLLLDEVWTGPVTGTVSRSYDNNLWVTGLTVNGAFTIPYRYDVDGLITNIGELCISRDAQNGWITGTELGVVSDAYAYNVFGEVTNYSVLVDGSNLYQAAFVRDGLGRITRETITDQGVTRTNTYTYDPAGRWLEAVTNGTTLRWSFDLNGNLTNFTRGGAVVASATYDAEDRLIQRGGDTYGYTARGTLSTAILSGVEYQYDYDLRGVLRGVSKSAGTVTGLTYVADGRGRRIARYADGVQTHGYLYSDELSLAAVLNPANEVEAILACAPGSSVPVYISITGRAYRIITDLRGSPLFVVDTVSGEIAQQMTYSVWGEVQSDSHSLFQPIGYAGGLYEPETGWVRFGKRDYDAAAGRWTAKDPAFFVEWVPNLYRYCRNDPINMIDSSGAVPTGRIKGGPEDAHSLPGAPSVTGPAVTGSATVWVNNKPALRVTDTGSHLASVGPGLWHAVGSGPDQLVLDLMNSSDTDTQQAASAIAAEAFIAGYNIGFTSDNQPYCIINESSHIVSPIPTPAPATE
jgi:RHS repeat-associated protein